MTVSAAKRSLGESPVVYAPLPEFRHIPSGSKEPAKDPHPYFLRSYRCGVGGAVWRWELSYVSYVDGNPVGHPRSKSLPPAESA
ncbi:hypothetical protein L211DRAFT_842880 [Terfezia boudieri ATCC MYA-4762]|uniref:Uncharacterized protein n=1 Tax=Terfezia boudieri ATCC MYA-4762 TaxID=1051890 RepID=A0A3N4LBQ2_9PEZI|nr:hypothetical protein L211DRAFT_842880 [Terfezia boudieri ATCC MYA-4762]